MRSSGELSIFHFTTVYFRKLFPQIRYRILSSFYRHYHRRYGCIVFYLKYLSLLLFGAHLSCRSRGAAIDVNAMIFCLNGF